MKREVPYKKGDYVMFSMDNLERVTRKYLEDTYGKAVLKETLVVENCWENPFGDSFCTMKVRRSNGQTLQFYDHHFKDIKDIFLSLQEDL